VATPEDEESLFETMRVCGFEPPHSSTDHCFAPLRRCVCAQKEQA
jgi:hypothetical protein